MSQSTLPEQSPHNSNPTGLDRLNPPEKETVSQSPVIPRTQDRWDDDEFHYKQIPVLSPVSLVLGLASLVVFVTTFGIIIGSVGMIIGLICFLGTVRNRDAVGGFRITVTGLILSTACVIFGSSKLVYDYTTEVPEGFRRTSFANDIAEKGFKYEKGKGTWAIHPEVEALDGQKIFVKGFMYPTRQKEGITEFILAKDNGQCCFGGEPKVTDMILVKMKKPPKVDFTDRRVSVAGLFRTQRNSSGGFNQVYELTAEYFAVSKTAF
jgi:hypothetical protein